MTTRRVLLAGVILFILLCLLAIPLAWPHVGWRLRNIEAQLYYAQNPPDQAPLIPAERVAALLAPTLQALTAQAATVTPFTVATPTPAPTLTGTALPGPTPIPAATLTSLPSLTPLPAQAALTGIRHQGQSYNNCGPAALAMTLSFWGWQGSQENIRLALRPNDEDLGVTTTELMAYTASQTSLRALSRSGGDLALLHRLIAAGFPVVIETGLQAGDDWWLGHYLVISGYDDPNGLLIAQDSLTIPDRQMAASTLLVSGWRDFNYTYLVVYPAERESELLALLGPDADSAVNAVRALDKSQKEIGILTGRDLFFALYNQGSNLLALGQSQAAADAYDLAFAVYPSLPENDRPWRIFWYDSAPFIAYYQAGRYQDVVDLTTSALNRLKHRNLEEAHYWRGMAYESLGHQTQAAEDYRAAIAIRPGYTAAIEALNRLGG